MIRLLLAILFVLLSSSGSYAYAAADPSANADVQAFLNWLEYIRDKAGTTQKIVIGQHIQDNDTASDWNNTDGGRYNVYVEDLYDATGKYVDGLGGCYISGYTNANTRYQTWWNSGGAYVYVVWRPHNPFDADCANLYTTQENCADYNDRGIDDYSNFDLDNLRVDDTKAPYDKWQAEKERIGDAFAALQTAGVMVLFRPLQEPNMKNMWWSYQPEGTIVTATEYKNLYIDMFEYITSTRGIHNVVWLYGPGPYWGQTASDRQSWYQWYPGDSYVDIIAPSIYWDSLVSEGTSSTWASIQTYGDTWHNDGIYTNLYYTTTGKPGSVRVNGVTYTERATLTLANSNANSWIWVWSNTTGGRLYVYEDPYGLSVECEYHYAGPSVKTEMLDMGKLVVMGETGSDNATYDLYNIWLATIKSQYTSFPLAHFWGGNWHISYNANENLMLNDAYVIDRDEVKPVAPALSSPQNGTQGISLTPTLQTTGYYGPRAHWKTRWEVCPDTDCGTITWDSGWLTDEATKTTNTVPGATLATSTLYYWRVKYAMNVNGSNKESDWSTSWNFTTSGGSVPVAGFAIVDGNISFGQ